jgi:hypothetical protein
VAHDVKGERKTKSVCEISDGKMKNEIFVRDEVTAERKTKSVSVREVTGK